MPTTLDLNLLPVARYAGRDYPELMGLHAATPPRRVARGRGQEHLILYLAMDGNAPLPPGQQSEILAGLARLYYDTSGSATLAMRRVAEELNTILFERNTDLERSSRQGLGLLAQIVVREQHLTLACSGPLHAFLIAAGETHAFYNPDMEGLGLGQGRNTPLSYSQATLQPNDTLLLAALPDPGWSAETLVGLHGQGPESLRRKLFAAAGLDLNAVLVQARPGKGNVYLPRPGAAAQAAAPGAETQEPAPPPSASQSSAPPASLPLAPVPTAQAVPPPAEPLRPKTIPIEAAPVVAAVTLAAGADLYTQAEPPAKLEGEPQPAGVESEPAVSAPAAAEEEALDLLSPADEPATESAPAGRPASSHRPAKTALARATLAVAGSIQRAGQATRALMARILPDDAFLSIPTSLLVLISIAVPVIIVAIASTAYFRLGSQAQYQDLLSQARDVAVRSAAESDVTTRRLGLESALGLLQKAESYGTSPEVQTLRSRVRSTLDEIDLVIRLDYQPAIINGLAANVNVVQMIPVGDNLYLLDSNSGAVLRAQWTAQGYQIDETFQCGADVAGASAMGPAIGIAAWPPGFEPEAEIIALDAKGNLLYCMPGRQPQSAQLAPGGDGSKWGDLRTFTLDSANLYVLDLASNQDWVYWIKKLAETPTPFFNEQPPPLQNVTGTGVNRDDLYLLNSDGSMVLCIPNTVGAGPTRCQVQPFVDFRPGRENQQLVPPGPFSQMQITQPPEPSLYMLEPLTQGVYHFSLRSLAFQRVYLPDQALPPRPATAFSVDTVGRNVFLALGSSVYYAALP